MDHSPIPRQLTTSECVIVHSNAPSIPRDSVTALIKAELASGEICRQESTNDDITPELDTRRSNQLPSISEQPEARGNAENANVTNTSPSSTSLTHSAGAAADTIDAGEVKSHATGEDAILDDTLVNFPIAVDDAGPTRGRWPKKVKAGRALLEVSQDMLERSIKLPILLHWRWTGKSINAMYLYQRSIFQGYVGTATCDVAVDMDIDEAGGPVAADELTSDHAAFSSGAETSNEPGPDAVCVLCGLPENRSRCMFTDSESKLDAGHLIRSKDGANGCWVHSKCAHFSQECALVMRAHALDNTDAGREDQKHQLHAALTLAVTNSAQRSCTLCQKPGATLRCAFCSKAYHYGCALHECCYMDHMEPYKFTCRAHSARITDIHEPNLQMMSPCAYPPAMNALMAQYITGQQRQPAPESNGTTEMNTSSDNDEDGSESSDHAGRASSQGALNFRSHLQPDKYQPHENLAQQRMRADQPMFGGMRQMTFMEPHLLGQAAQQAISQPGATQSFDDQGEWCYDRFLGGTTGQKGRHGRCSVCLVQRKGRCGTESAPGSCIRVLAYVSQGKAVPSAPPKQTRKRVSLAHHFPQHDEPLAQDG